MKKTILGIVIAIVAVVGATVWWMQANLDDLIGKAITHYGSAMTGAKVSVGSVELRAKEGRVIVRDLRVGNPPGFKTTHALLVQELELAIDVSSVRGEVVTIPKILIRAPDLIYEKAGEASNFGAIRTNIATYRGKERTAPGSDTNKSGSRAKKLIIGELRLTEAHANASATFLEGKTLAVKIPDVVLRDLGKDKGGVLPGEMGQEIVQALERQLAASFGLEGMPKPVGEAVDKAKDAFRNLLSK